jgi:hypothetical protein
MKTTIKLLSYILLLVVSVACSENEAEENLENEIPIDDVIIDKKLQSSERIARGRIRRIRLRKMRVNQRLDLGYQIITDIPNNENTAEVASIDMKISNGDTKNATTIFLKQTSKNNQKGKVRKYISEEFDLPFLFLGKTVTVTSIDRDIKGNQIGKPYTEKIEVNGTPVNELVSITQPELKLNKDGENFTMKVALKEDPKYPYLKLEMKEIMISSKVIPDDGGSETEETEIRLTYQGQNEDGLFMFENKDVRFIESDNVVDMEYLITTTLSKIDSEELDYAEFRITGLE